MYVLDKLWRGELTPSESDIPHDAAYHEKLLELSRLADQLSEELGQNGQGLFEAFRDTQMELQSIENQEAFTTGFRIGTGLLLDAITGM